MDDQALSQRVLHLRQVENLSQRQIAELVRISRKRVRRILQGSEPSKPVVKASPFTAYISLIAHWYKQYSRLQAIQVYERLKPYGYQGSYVSVVRLTREYRAMKQTAYHPLTFLPGEEAQVDWFFYNDDRLGQMAGFIYVLAYSRYAWGIFYPRTTFEFFLAGHMECFNHIGGLAHRHRYDNLKSVVLKRDPEIEYNPQFMDFARFYSFSIHACNPYSGNEKGRVERLVRDIRAFLYGETFADIADLNDQFHRWLENRNTTIHRTTGKTPKELLAQERLIPLPEHPYPPSRVIQALVSKTAFIEFDTNIYSVPTTCAGKTVTVAAYPGYIEVYLSESKIAIHERSFGKKQKIDNPLHAEKLLATTPAFKMRRILDLITGMDPILRGFLDCQDTDSDRINAAYHIFSILRTHSRAMVISAVRELVALSCFKIKALNSLLQLPESQEPQPLWPKNMNLLNLKYQERSLTEYDKHSQDMGTA